MLYNRKQTALIN